MAKEINEDFKQNLSKFSASSGWVSKFKNRYKIVSRKITTKIKKRLSEVQEQVEAYFSLVRDITKQDKNVVFVNFDQVAIFFELHQNFTREVEGKGCVGVRSTGKDKERINSIICITSCGHVLPPVVIFKTKNVKHKISFLYNHSLLMHPKF